MRQMVAGMVTCLAALRDLPHHLALEVGVVARALPWGPDRGVDGLLHIHFQQLVVVEPDDLVAEVLVAVLVAKDVSDLPSREAARHRGQLAGAEGVAALPGVGLEKGEVDGVVAHPPPAWRGGPAEAPVSQGRVAVWGAMDSSLVHGWSRCSIPICSTGLGCWGSCLRPIECRRRRSCRRRWSG